jgi:Xaa-Pro aminopeptidase
MEELDLDGMLLISEPNISYLTGFSGDSSRLLVSKMGCVFLTDGRYTEQAVKEIHPEIEVFKWIDDKRYGIETYQKFVDAFQITNLGFESDIMSFAIHQKFEHGVKNVQMIPTEGLVETLRMVKNEKEIEILRHACKISDKALELALPLIKAGITEKELAAHLEFNMKMEGADDISFPTIILFGNRTSLLHGGPGDTKLQNGDFVQFDFGALYHGYHADMSRTFVIGKASQKQKELYKIMQTAEMKAIESLKHGVEGNYPDTIVRQVIPDSYINDYYPGLGHGVGLVIHEEPFIKNSSNFTFQSGMVVTIEPGVYIPGWGGMRIEDTVLVKENGYEMLTHFPRELMEL